MPRIALLALLMGFCVGGWVSYKSWDGRIFFYLFDNTREPNSVPNVFDFSNLEGAAFDSASKSRLLEAAEINKNNDQLALQLGHFVMKGPSGHKTLACREFDRVELIFHSEGSSVSGEPTVMTIDGQCQALSDAAKMNPILIPVPKILAERIGNVELQYWDNQKTNIKFSNTGDNWPKQWVLRQARLYNSLSDDKQLLISRDEIRNILVHPFMMDWSDFQAAAQ